MVTIEQVKELRDKTGISIAQCKTALEAAGGDMTKATEALKAAGAAIAEKKAGRTLNAGKISAYIHSTGNIGALVEVHSESDFVAKNPEFRALADELAMQVAAMEPADVPALLDQPYIKDPSQTIKDLVQAHTQKFGERIEVIRFVRLDTSGS